MAPAPAVARWPVLAQPVVSAASGLAAAHWPALAQQAAASRSALFPWAGHPVVAAARERFAQSQPAVSSALPLRHPGERQLPVEQHPEESERYVAALPLAEVYRVPWTADPSLPVFQAVPAFQRPRLLAADHHVFLRLSAARRQPAAEPSLQQEVSRAVARPFATSTALPPTLASAEPTVARPSRLVLQRPELAHRASASRWLRAAYRAAASALPGAARLTVLPPAAPASRLPCVRGRLHSAAPARAVPRRQCWP